MEMDMARVYDRNGFSQEEKEMSHEDIRAFIDGVLIRCVERESAIAQFRYLYGEYSFSAEVGIYCRQEKVEILWRLTGLKCEQFEELANMMSDFHAVRCG